MAQPATAAVRLLAGERQPVRLATTANIALYGLQTIDAVEVQVGDRVLVKDQKNATQNGIYTASDGHWRRPADTCSPRALQRGTMVYVREGAISSHLVYAFETVSPVVGADPIVLSCRLSDYILGDVVGADNSAMSSR
ncbi:MULTISPECIES: hypothetical protein [unclassified Mesorhizobium]|uniref:hypothetical protein n=1 Tax=unclassified Mesorhizobium TaxID=325217 RepID=UPI001128AC6A|nr:MULTISPECIES: hypothetical protein [unclassified Mesorhizobium]TPK68239.1 hypothetical protein FJ551_00420 [Mesorhizobium sp. B2-5-1]TPM62484.1 hypothetical protein FJ962_08760 [Mesorhizobium sp. B2-1-9]TPM87834.1 hypothetical protein FJ963_07510 [Mesorhizobium sp. B2-1-4]TPN12624.1 hypothetical protein FJ971_07965 [Mesorhizobium sp. B2-1-2]UCI15833.1 hypothetical protein FJ972_13750 [Mesorhizobium sp. B2-1-1]